jgi:hypothetical protein
MKTLKINALFVRGSQQKQFVPIPKDEKFVRAKRSMVDFSNIFYYLKSRGLLSGGRSRG